MKPTIIFGPPGTGKTTKLMQLMETAFEQGYEPEDIAFVSFTKAAVQEAIQRATKRFNFGVRRLRNFRTLHSLAYASIGVGREAVMMDYADFASEYGFNISKRIDEGGPAEASKGDDLLVRAKGLCDATGLDIGRIQREYNLPISLMRYETFIERLNEWKQKHNRVEFSDMINMFLKNQMHVDVRIAFVDEAQDLTPVQWQMVELAFAHVEKLFIAGDDDQAIYHWAGADVNKLLQMPAERHVLQQSYRVPEAVHAIAAKIVERIEERQPKQWRAKQEQGEVEHNASLRALSLNGDASWMLLARTSMTLPTYIRELESRGIMYRYNGAPSVPDNQVHAFKTLQALRNGERVNAIDIRKMLMFTDKLPGMNLRTTKITARDFPESVLGRDDWMLNKLPPTRVRFLNRCLASNNINKPVCVDVSTIHQAKGAEADNVVLSLDLTAATASALANARHSASEHRVMYVGATRAKKSLFLLRPEAENSYRIT